eukprot:gene2185-2049_t
MGEPSSVEDHVIPELINIWNNYRNSYTTIEKESLLFSFTKTITEEALSTPNIHQIFQLNSDIPTKEIISCLSEEFFIIVGKYKKHQIENDDNYSLIQTLSLFIEDSTFVVKNFSNYLVTCLYLLKDKGVSYPVDSKFIKNSKIKERSFGESPSNLDEVYDELMNIIHSGHTLYEIPSKKLPRKTTLQKTVGFIPPKKKEIKRSTIQVKLPMQHGKIIVEFHFENRGRKQVIKSNQPSRRSRKNTTFFEIAEIDEERKILENNEKIETKPSEYVNLTDSLIFNDSKNLRVKENELDAKMNEIDLKMNTNFTYFPFEHSIMNRTNQPTIIILSSILNNISNNKSTFEELFIESSNWILMINGLLNLGKITKIEDFELFVHFSNLITKSFSNSFSFVNRLDFSKEDKEIIPFILKTIKQGVKLLKENEKCYDSNLFRLSLLYLSEILILIIFDSLNYSSFSLELFEESSGYDVLYLLFMVISRWSESSSEENILIFEKQKMILILKCMTLMTKNITNYSKIKSFEKIKKIPFDVLPVYQDINSDIFPILLEIFNNSNMNLLNGNFEKNYCFKFEILKIIIDIINEYEFQYFQNLAKYKPFWIIRKSFSEISPKMQEMIICSMENFMNFFSEIYPENQDLKNSLKKSNSKRTIISKEKPKLEWIQILCRDTKQYCSLLEISSISPNSVLRICSHVKSLLRRTDDPILIKSTKILFRESGMTESLLNSLNVTLKERNHEIMSELLDILFLYLSEDLKNHHRLLSHDIGVNTLYDLLYDEKLIVKSLKILRLISINDTEQEFSIISDLISILSNIKLNQVERTTPLLKLCDLILKSLQTIFRLNPKTKSTFRNRGFESLLSIFDFLTSYSQNDQFIENNEKEGNEKDLIFIVLQSILMTLSLALENNDVNRSHFQENIKFHSLYQPLNELKFLNDKKYGLHLCLNLLQLSLITPDLYLIKCERNSLDENDSKEFLENIKRGVFLFQNPEVICDVLLILIANNLSDIDIEISEFVFEVISILVSKFASNRTSIFNAGFNRVILSNFKEVIIDKNHDLQLKLLNLFIEVASFHFSILDLQNFFSLLSDGKYPDNFLSALLDLSKDKYSPNNYIDFLPLSYQQNSTNEMKKRNDRIIPHILFPNLSFTPFPPLKGYTILSWIKIEGFAFDYFERHPKNKPGVISSTQHNKRLEDVGIYIFSFCADDRKFIVEGFITKDMYFALKIIEDMGKDFSISAKQEILTFKNFKFKKGKWYSIGFSHSQVPEKNGIKHIFGLFVNGKFKEEMTISLKEDTGLSSFLSNYFMKYPRLQTICLGSSWTSYVLKGKKVKETSKVTNIFSSFQLGNVHMIEGVLSELEIYTIYHLGPNYIGSFQEQDLTKFFSQDVVNPSSVSKFPKFVSDVMNDSVKISLNLHEHVLFIFSAKGGILSSRFAPLPKIFEKLDETKTTAKKLFLDGNIDFQEADFIGSNFSKVNQRSGYGILGYDDDEFKNLSSMYNFRDPLIFQKYGSFIPIQTIINGSVDIVSNTTFKNNLYGIGGVSSILSLLSTVQTTPRKIKIIQILSFLLRYNSTNYNDMKKINGYDVMNHIMRGKKFEVKSSVLAATLMLLGLRIPIESCDNEKFDIVNSQGCLTDKQSFEFLILDYSIWKRSPLETQKKLFETILYLVRDHPFSSHQITTYRSIDIIDKILDILLPYTTNQDDENEENIWPRVLIKPTVEILRSVLPQPSRIRNLLPIFKFIIATHPSSKDSKINFGQKSQQLLSEPRRSIIELVYDILESLSDEILDEMYSSFQINVIIGLLEHHSAPTRLELLKILFLFLNRRDNLKDVFNRTDGLKLLTNQLIKFPPSIPELQILFDMLVGKKYEENSSQQNSTPLPPKDLNFSSDDEDEIKTFSSTRQKKNSKIESFKKPKTVKSLTIDKKSYTADDFKNPEFLTLILKLIPSIKSIKDKMHVTQTLQDLFRYGGPKTKLSFINLGTHRYLIKCLWNDVVQGDNEYMNIILDFLIKYICFAIDSSNKQFLDLLSEIIDSFYFLECYSTIFNHNLQRYVLNGILTYFQQNYLLDTKKPLNTKWGVSFARFCTCAVDHILQWFKLPSSAPTFESSSNSFSDDISMNPDESDFSDSKSTSSSNKRKNQKDQIDISTETNLYTSFNLVNYKPKFLDRDLRNMSFGKDIPKIKDLKFLPDTPKGKKNRKQNEIYLKMLDAYEEQLEGIHIESEKLFIYKIHEISGFTFWLLESMKLYNTLSNVRASIEFFSSNTTDIILATQIKRLILDLLNEHRTVEENYFALLNLLYTYPTSVVDEANYSQQDLRNFCTDQVFITKLITKSIHHFTKKDLLLQSLTNQIWSTIIIYSQSYLRDIFPLAKLGINPQDKDFIETMINIISMNYDYRYIVFENAVATKTQKWNENEFQEIQTKLLNTFKSYNSKESEEKEIDKKASMTLITYCEKLGEKQTQFLYPFITTKAARIEKENLASLKFTKILKNFLSERSISNSYHFSFKLKTQQEEFLKNMLVDYTVDTSKTCWKLDSTEGPHRMRSKIIKREIIETTPQQKVQLMLNQETKGTQQQQQMQVNTSVEQNGQSEMNDMEKREKKFEISEPMKSTIYQCGKITPLCKFEGELAIGGSAIFFQGEKVSHDNQSITEEKNQRIHKKVSFDDIKEIHKRRYLLQDSAMEIFLTNGKSIMYAFNNQKDRDTIYITLSNTSMPNIQKEYQDITSNFKSITTRKWQEGQISNFDYLMRLNTSAGRSFNDLTQYPVFPHVISDYSSESIDLSNPKVYRDLSKPMGALNEQRKEKAELQYENLTETGNPYHWGTHYSTRMSVLFYLVRLEPYTRCFWELNGRKLDIPDRTFHSMIKSWELSSGIHSKSDVKELIPEFFYLPEFLENVNRINFGLTQSENFVDNIELPPWTGDSAIKFIKTMREALESDYVSQNLHHWIDLIFGYKQQGEHAISAVNVFHPLTYADCIEEIELIDDIVLKEAKWSQINHYGQTPKQLFTKPHPSKFPQKINENIISICAQSLCETNNLKYDEPIGDLILNDDSTIYYVPKNKIFIPTQDKKNLNYVHLDWDESLSICKLETQKILQNFESKVLPETLLCFSCGNSGKTFASGSNIGVVNLYKSKPKEVEHCCTFNGHSSEILSIAVNDEFGIIVSGSSDNSAIIWDINRERYLRSIKHEGIVTAVAVSPTTGDIATFSIGKSEGNIISLFGINGVLIAKKELTEPVTCLKFSSSEYSQYTTLIAGLKDGCICLLNSNLEILSRLMTKHHCNPITSIAINSYLTEIATGDKEGNVVIWSKKILK